jgi:hypothetical protein
MRWRSAVIGIAVLALAGTLVVKDPRPSFEARALAMNARPLTIKEELTQQPLSAPKFRCQQAECSARYLQYEVLVDASGRPVSAILRDAVGEVDRDLRTQADAYVRSLRYPPLAHPKPVRMWEQVDVYPPVRVPARSVPLPVYDASTVRITLERTGCFGSCPSYKVSVAGDGSVLFDGQSYVAEVGRRSGNVDPSSVRVLYDQFRTSDFMSLDDRYVADITDNPTYTLTLETAGMRKTVVDYVGVKAGMPDSVTALEDAVDRVAGTSQWIGPPQPW